MLKISTLTIIAILAGSAQAEQTYEMFYMKGNHKIENGDAILAAAKGEQVFKCQSVEAKLSKSQTSLSVRNVKRPKVK